MSLDEPILIWGAGAIGGTLGAYFVRAGHRVIFVDSAEEHVNAINQRGLRITGPIAEFAVQAEAFMPEELNGRFSTTFLCVKAHHTKAAIAELAKHLEPEGFVVSAQNGLNEIEIAEGVGKERTVGCFVNFGADYLEPGCVHYGGRGAVVVGELDGQTTSRLSDLHQLMKEFDSHAVRTDNIWGYLWGKMAYGAQLFATALTNASIAEALAAPEHHRLFAEIAREVLRVAAAGHIRPEGFNGFAPQAFMPGTPPEAARQSLERMAAHNRKSAKSHSGIWRDLAVRKRKTEVDAQLGPVVSIGRERDVPTPLTRRLIEMIHEIENGSRKLDWGNLAELEQVLP